MVRILLEQTIVMGLYMAAGYILLKTGKITEGGSRILANLLLWLIIPCVLIRAFCVPFSAGQLRLLGQSFLLATLAMGISIALSVLLLRKRPLECFATSFSNAGFIGIPLVTAALGEQAVFFLCGLLVWVNLLQWTWGTAVMRGERVSVSPGALLHNPFVIATLIGLFLFCTGLGARLPAVISKTMDGIAGLNGPLAMLVLGVYLAQTRLGKLFTTPRLYLLSLIRLWVIPLVTLAVFCLLPFETDARLAVLIAASTPIGANAAVYAQLYDADYPYACQMVALCTLVSLVLLPLFMLLATAALGM